MNRKPVKVTKSFTYYTAEIINYCQDGEQNQENNELQAGCKLMYSLMVSECMASE